MNKEKLSEKPKRGRPKNNDLAEEALAFLKAYPGWLDRMKGESERTLKNEAFRLLALSAVQHAEAEAEVWGGARPPKGWKTAALEMGKYINAEGIEEDAARRVLVAFVAEERKKGTPWAALAERFKKARLKPASAEACPAALPEGCPADLFSALGRTLEDYRRAYTITNEQTRAAVEALLSVLPELNRTNPGELNQ